MIKAIIFDCFGVVAGAGFAHTYKMAGGDPEKDAKFINEILERANSGGISRDDFDQAIAKKIGISVDRYVSVIFEENTVNQQLYSLIKQLAPKYKIGMLSNVNRGTLPKILPAHVRAQFDDIIESAEVGLLKPDPRVYKLAAKQLGVEIEECIFVDDNQENCEGARDVGMKAILYRDFDQFEAELAPLLTN